MQKALDELVTLGQKALEFKGQEAVADFAEAVETYLSALELWQKQVKEDNPFADESSFSDAEKADLRALVEKLGRIHEQLMEQAETAKDNVAGDMGSVHRRASGLKRYIDQYPSRMSLTGKRQG